MDLVKRFEIYFIELDPTKGSEINKTRPAVIISPAEMNVSLNTVIVAPLTSTIKNYPSRINIVVNNKIGQIALDQIRAVDKSLIKNKLAVLPEKSQNTLLEVLQEMFSK